MVDIVFEIAVNLFQSFMFIGFLYQFFDKAKNKLVRMSGFYGSIALFFIVLNFFTFNPQYVVFNEALIFIGIMMLYTVCFLKGNIFIRLIMPSICYVVNAVIAFLLIYSFSFVTGDVITQLIYQYSFYRYFWIVIANVTNLIVFVMILRLSKKKIRITNSTDTIAFIIIPILTLIIIYCTFLVLTKTGYRTDIMIFLWIICVCMLVVTIIVWFMMWRISKDNEIKTKLLLSEQRERLYEENVIQTNEQIEKITKIKHDMKNNLMCIDKMISDENLSEAKRLCNNLQINLSGVYTPLNTNNLLLNAIVNVELEKATTNDIDFLIDIRDEMMYLANSHDIVSIIGNLCDNAIEYLNEIPSGLRQMRLEVSKHNNYYIITCKNKIINSILSENPNLISNKDDLIFHGKGTQILKNIAQKYHGNIKNYEENNFFCTSIIIKVPSLPEN